jgi:ribonuclease-3 family protein
VPSPPPDRLPDEPPGRHLNREERSACSNWLPQGAGLQAAELGPLQLAWLGDAVWELHQRLRHCREPGRSDALHRAVVEEVRAGAQAEALARLDPLLTDQERDWVRRGRNRAGRGPRRGNAATYGQATGFETMVGWLFLRNPGRLAQLLDHLEQPGPDPLPDLP